MARALSEGRGAVYLLDKSPGPTSRKAASAVAAAWGRRKFGHAGTLDPAASGVLPVLLGSATRLSDYLIGHEKRYSFSVVTGIETDTLDSEGRVTRTSPPVTPAAGLLEEILCEFTGTFEQKAPAFSAIKLAGRPAYRMARSGSAPEMPVRTVCAGSWLILSVEEGIIRLEVTVSSGTYIRSLAADIGTRLGCGAHAAGITRERMGPFSRADCSPDADCPRALLSPVEALRGFPRIDLTRSQAERVVHGNSFESSMEGTCALLDSEDGTLLAIGSGDGLLVKPSVVLETL